MAKRTQRNADSSSEHWYQDKYQYVLVQRNVLALISLAALICALAAVAAVMHFTPLKTVEPYLLQIDLKSGVTQKVDPISRNQYAASEAVDRYFSSMYIRLRENYNYSIWSTNYNLVRLMSAPAVFSGYRAQVQTTNPASPAATLGAAGIRDVKINSMSYVQNPRLFGQKEEVTPVKIIQARITTTDTVPNAPDVVQQWVVTLNFQYATLELNEEEKLLNPLGFIVTSYQIQREIN